MGIRGPASIMQSCGPRKPANQLLQNQLRNASPSDHFVVRSSMRSSAFPKPLEISGAVASPPALGREYHTDAACPRPMRLSAPDPGRHVHTPNDRIARLYLHDPKLRDRTLRIQDIFTLYVVNGAAATAAEPDDPTPSLSLFSCASPAACSPDFCAADTVRFIQLVEQA
jgi:hypothetical protein